MSSRLADVIWYLCRKYPHAHELSKARVTKMVYLADWRAAIQRGEQLTTLEWTFNHYGPYLNDVIDTARTDAHLEVSETTNMYGSLKEVIHAKDRAGELDLTTEDRGILDHVIEETKDLYWKDFIRLVYSTYPIVTQPRYAELDLPTLAAEYATVQKSLA